MPKISLIVHTASLDNFLSCHGIPSAIEMLADMLENQIYKDFEFIYVDTYYEENKEKVSNIKSTFTIKHVPIHSNHRYWYDMGHTYIAAAKNTGILYADGELCVTCDDAELFPGNFLKKYWDYYSKQKLLMHAFHKRMTAIRSVSNGKITFPIDGDFYVNDSRSEFGGNVVKHQNGSWMYAGTSFTMDAALKLNGFNERMDGYKSLEDCDFGIRMTLIGEKFVLDKNAFLYILEHPNYFDNGKKKIDYFIPYENYSMIRCAIELNDFVANKSELTEEHLKIIQKVTLQYRQFDPLAIENAEKFEIWKKTPKFDLTQERIDLRNSTEWKW